MLLYKVEQFLLYHCKVNIHGKTGRASGGPGTVVLWSPSERHRCRLIRARAWSTANPPAGRSRPAWTWAMQPREDGPVIAGWGASEYPAPAGAHPAGRPPASARTTSPSAESLTNGRRTAVVHGRRVLFVGPSGTDEEAIGAVGSTQRPPIHDRECFPGRAISSPAHDSRSPAPGSTPRSSTRSPMTPPYERLASGRSQRQSATRYCTESRDHGSR
jgi:hypothetical protein